MNIHSKKYLFVFLFCYFQLSLFYAQNNIETIKVKKVQQLVKAEYDNSKYKLFAVDRFGNPKETAIRSFELHFTIGGIGHNYVSSSEYLTDEMIENLHKIKNSQEIVFSDIKAVDDNGNWVDLPKLKELVFPEKMKGFKNRK